jgi:arylsulfatase A-like enzyme
MSRHREDRTAMCRRHRGDQAAMCRRRRNRAADQLPLAAVILLALAAGCSPLAGPPAPPPIVELPALAPPPPSHPDGERQDMDGEGDAALALADERRFIWPGGASWRLATGGAPGELLLGAGGRPLDLAVEVDLESGGRRRPLLRAALPSGRWSDRAVAVPAAGPAASLIGRLAGCDGRSCGWSAAAFVPNAPRRQAAGSPLNVVLVLADTLRADALGAYGAAGNPSPTLDGLARAGTRFAQAHAAASWTLPSIASLFTSLPAYRAGHYATQPQYLYRESRTLAAEFAAAGYWTAAFSGSAIVSYDTGFGQGFGCFWADPLERLRKPDARDVARRAAVWLRANQHHPFFAYVHFQDCHSPYCRARDLPADPRAPVPGDSDPARDGKRPLPGAAELAEWRRLYATDVTEVDRGVAQVLDALEPAVRANTLVAFVADHGEEFLDHGYLGHGWSLFEELVHVPLLLAGAGVPAGRVVAVPVSLLDVMPTLTARAGLAVPPSDRRSWQGIDLGPALAGLPLPARRPLLAQAESFGPTRISVAAGPLKAVLFNLGAPRPAGTGAGSPIDARVAQLLPREALFDLAADPGEQRNLAGLAVYGAFLRGVRDLALAHLSTVTSGRWVALRGPGGGGLLRGRVRYAAAPPLVLPFFLRQDEKVTFNGDAVEVRLHDDGAVRGWLIPDRPGLRVLGADLTADSRTLTRAAWQPGAGALPPRAWAEWPATRPRPRDVVSSEFIRRLRALGYIQ